MTNHRIFHLEIHLDSRSIVQPAMLVYRGSFYKQAEKCTIFTMGPSIPCHKGCIHHFLQTNQLSICIKSHPPTFGYSNDLDRFTGKNYHRFFFSEFYWELFPGSRIKAFQRSPVVKPKKNHGALIEKLVVEPTHLKKYANVKMGIFPK